MQLPEALHVSSPLHGLPSGQGVPNATGECTVLPVVGSQASAVHGLLSSAVGFAAPAHTPPEHVSETVHGLLSLQLAVRKACTHLSTSIWHESEVQSLPSSQLGC